MSPKSPENERLAVLEYQMAETGGIEYRLQVLTSLSAIERYQKDFESYQATCDAQREAHEKRITDLENSRKITKSVIVILTSISSAIGVLIGIVISAAGLFSGHK